MRVGRCNRPNSTLCHAFGIEDLRSIGINLFLIVGYSTTYEVQNNGRISQRAAEVDAERQNLTFAVDKHCAYHGGNQTDDKRGQFFLVGMSFRSSKIM